MTNVPNLTFPVGRTGTSITGPPGATKPAAPKFSVHPVPGDHGYRTDGSYLALLGRSRWYIQIAWSNF